MIGCLDVQYEKNQACAGLVLFDDWSSAVPSATHFQISEVSETYVPGQFFRRELPCILSVLNQIAELPAVFLIDGYVWLEGEKMGLGAHLYEALDERIIVVGVAKSSFRNSGAIEVRRGTSTRPLYVTAAGMPAQSAADSVGRMHGRFRLPTMVKFVDRLAREQLSDVLKIKSDRP